MTPDIRLGGRLALALLLAAALLAGCGPKGADDVSRNEAEDCAWTGGDLPVVPDLDNRLAAYVKTDIDPDISQLDATQQAVLAKLVEAAEVMDDLFAEQATPCRTELAARIDELPAALQAAGAALLRHQHGALGSALRLRALLRHLAPSAGSQLLSAGPDRRRRRTPSAIRRTGWTACSPWCAGRPAAAWRPSRTRRSSSRAWRRPPACCARRRP